MTRRAATNWTFPAFDELPDDDLVAFGADLEPTTLIDAYRSGYFPMPLSVRVGRSLRPGRLSVQGGAPRIALPRRRIGWFCPVERGVFLPGDFVVSRSLRRSRRHFTVSVDEAFTDVISACADPTRPHGWIDRSIIDAYTQLHHGGIAHSVEVWDDDGLAGGLYGVALGGLFAGESMFHRRTDASKVALAALIDMMGPEPDRLLDVQWQTPHLATLGCRTVGRLEYGLLLERALRLGTPLVFDGPPLSGDNDA